MLPKIGVAGVPAGPKGQFNTAYIRDGLAIMNTGNQKRMDLSKDLMRHLYSKEVYRKWMELAFPAPAVAGMEDLEIWKNPQRKGFLDAVKTGILLGYPGPPTPAYSEFNTAYAADLGGGAHGGRGLVARAGARRAGEGRRGRLLEVQVTASASRARDERRAHASTRHPSLLTLGEGVSRERSGAVLRRTRYSDLTARHKEWVLGYAMLVPAFFFIVGLIAYPAAWAIYLSFTDKVIGQPEKFVGLQNYIWLTQWPNFGGMIWNTVAACRRRRGDQGVRRHDDGAGAERAVLRPDRHPGAAVPALDRAGLRGRPDLALDVRRPERPVQLGAAWAWA